MAYQIQRVYDYKGGAAVLADRLWPRGISKAKMAGVTWAKDITPSAALRKWLHDDRSDRYDLFCSLYREELAQPAAQSALDSIRRLHDQTGNLLLLTAAKDVAHSHMPVLLSALANKPEETPPQAA